MSELGTLTLREAAAAVQDRAVSPVELTRACLDRAAAIESSTNAFITIDHDGALAAATELEADVVAGRVRGPVHGVPIAVKDIFNVAGLPTTAASAILANAPPETADCGAVARLRAAGAIILGKLNLHEFAFGATGVDSHVGPAHNPWDQTRVTGGSSSGSGAAVAAGECFGALGTDTGGSIRIPASLCGIVGLKPTFGRVSRRGVYPLSWSLDHVGPMARSVEDVALLMQVIAGHDETDRSSALETVPDYLASLDAGLEGLRIGIPDSFFFDAIDGEVAAGVGSAIELLGQAGAIVEPVALPRIAETPSALTCIMLPEATAVHRRWMGERPGDYSDNVRYRLELGATFNAVHYVEAQRFRQTVIAEWEAEVFSRFDVIVTPATATPAPLIEESDLSATTGLIRLTNPLNFLGVPAISVPCGFTSAGLPFGLQLAGSWWDESAVLRAARAFEMARGEMSREMPI